jgi:hypothetical protein
MWETGWLWPEEVIHGKVVVVVLVTRKTRDKEEGDESTNWYGSRGLSPGWVGYGWGLDTKANQALVWVLSSLYQ